MRYDPFSARNLLRIVSLTGLVIMMTEAAAPTAGLAVGLFCLASAAILAPFSGGAAAVSTKRRAATAQSDRPAPAGRPEPVVRAWTPPGQAPVKPSVEPHPSIFATVAGRTTGLSSRRGR